MAEGDEQPQAGRSLRRRKKHSWSKNLLLTVLSAFENCKKRLLASSCLSVHYVRLSVRPHGTAQLPREGFSRNSIFEYFSKCSENSASFVKIWQEQRVLYIRTTRHFLLHPAQFFFEWEIFQTKFLEKIRKNILCSITFFEIRAFYEIG